MGADLELRGLLRQHESDFPDFKQKHYATRKCDQGKASLIKDLLAFANTCRGNPGYIIVGAKAESTGGAVVVGLADDESRDDAEFQDIVTGRK